MTLHDVELDRIDAENRARREAGLPPLTELEISALRTHPTISAPRRSDETAHEYELRVDREHRFAPSAVSPQRADESAYEYQLRAANAQRAVSVSPQRDDESAREYQQRVEREHGLRLDAESRVRRDVSPQRANESAHEYQQRVAAAALTVTPRRFDESEHDYQQRVEALRLAPASVTAQRADESAHEYRLRVEAAQRLAASPRRSDESAREYSLRVEAAQRLTRAVLLEPKTPSVEALGKDVRELDALVRALQATPDEVTAGDQALLDRIEVKATAAARRFEDLSSSHRPATGPAPDFSWISPMVGLTKAAAEEWLRNNTPVSSASATALLRYVRVVRQDGKIAPGLFADANRERVNVYVEGDLITRIESVG